MNSGVRTGIYFGATSGVITTIGLMVGLNSGTQSVVAVIGGVAVIAVADAMSDALGIHLAQESDPNTTSRHVWSATLAAFVTKFLITLSFVIPVVLMPLKEAIIASIVWGYLIIGVLSYFLARNQNAKVFPVLAEHLAIATFVVIAAHFIGLMIRALFG